MITQAANAAAWAALIQPPRRPRLTSNPNTILQNQGTAHINGNQVLVGPDDILGDNVTTLYFDLIGDLGGGVKLANKSFFEYLDNINENAYGFSQYYKTWVLEDKFVVSMKLPVNDWLKSNVEFGPICAGLEGGTTSAANTSTAAISQPSSPLIGEPATAPDFLFDRYEGHSWIMAWPSLADTTMFENPSAGRRRLFRHACA